MERKTFRILFLLRKCRTGKNGLAPILARITTNGLQSEIYIQCHVSPAKWNQTKERATGNDRLSCQVNTCLDDFRARILEIRQELIDEGYDGNAVQIKERFAKPKHSALMFLAELGKYCEKRQTEVGVRITQLTANKYHRIFRYLTAYTQEVYGKDDVLLSAVNYEYIDSFNTYLQTRYRCKHNGAVNLLCCLKNFIFYCLRNEWITKNPFQSYKLKEEHNYSKDHLVKSEIDTLIAKEMPNRRLEAVRDVFVFCCLTALAFTDADHLRKEHISKDDDGRLWVHKPREKTGVMSAIPLLPHAIEILRKYENDEICREKGKLLPVPSNQKMNSYLKEIATICNIDKTLTTHVARHSFACLAMELSIPIDIIAKVLGHTNTNMTRRYAKLSESAIGREVSKIADVFAQ
jgi:site-specific recombinase XerD